MIKFKVGDKVKVTSGKDKGRDGNIERVFSKKLTAVIPGVNIYKKHVKAMPGRKGGIFEIPRPLPFSKITIVCPLCSKLCRVGFRKVGNKSVRVCKKCNREIDINSKKK
jgi:large subunit ribosomal protein L24